MQKISVSLQTVGRTLMLPIAVLPVAGLILRLGQADLLDQPFLAAAGTAIFANLGLLFAAGVAIGLARENHGAAALAGIVAFLVASNGAQALVHVPADLGTGLDTATQALAAADFRQKAIAQLGVPLGILSGIAAGWLYNRYSTIKLPEFLAFFGGRRFVPIMAGFVGVGLAVLFGLGWPIMAAAIDGLSRGIAHSGWVGLFAYGVLNRILIVTGLHHILNNVAWFIVGNYHGATGDLNRFFAGDPTAGGFMSGFFPVMMFGLPAACFAMYRAALPEERGEVSGMYLSLALTSFLTGVTEPIEFTFMFVAPALYVLHALLTGVAMAAMSLLDIHLGFGFSAGLFDYLLNFRLASRPLLLLPIGAVYAAIYYFAFSTVIRRFNLQTPGRAVRQPSNEPNLAIVGERGPSFVAALGGANNLQSVDACTTRLRLVVVSQAKVNEPALKALGARGFIRPSKDSLQVVLGPVADSVASEMKVAMARDLQGHTSPLRDKFIVQHAVNDKGIEEISPHLLDALGGSANIRDVERSPDRLLVTLNQLMTLDNELLGRYGIKSVAYLSNNRIHLLRD